jgi:hypothetical protein
MSSHAKGSKAFGFCDRSGFRYPLKDLVPQYENQRPNGLLVGKDMLDIDHEQLQLGKVDASDPQTLENPRPDKELAESRRLHSWNPVGAVGLGMTGHVGQVKIVIS